MRADTIPEPVWRSAGTEPGALVGVRAVPLTSGTGAASAETTLITGEHRDGTVVRVVRKRFAPLTSGPHAGAARAQDHWAHWRRELTAHRAGVLPAGPVLRAPRLLAVDGDTLYTEYVGQTRPAAERAAFALGRWHALDRIPDLPWLVTDQLAQRLAVGDRDWSDVDVDDRLTLIWARRTDALARLSALPHSIAHGDAQLDNLRVDDAGVVALDWATLGRSPVGFDLAHLALDTLDADLLPPYLAGLDGRYDAAAVAVGYRTAVSLVGASRVHWMAGRSIAPPSGYVEFVAGHHG